MERFAVFLSRSCVTQAVARTLTPLFCWRDRKSIHDRTYLSDVRPGENNARHSKSATPSITSISLPLAPFIHSAVTMSSRCAPLVAAATATMEVPYTMRLTRDSHAAVKHIGHGSTV